MEKERKVRLEQLSVALPIRDLYALYRELKPKSEEEDDFSIYLNLLHDQSLVRIGALTGLISREEVAELFNHLDKSVLPAADLCRVLPYWFILARDFSEIVERRMVLETWHKQLTKLEETSEKFAHWGSYLLLVKPEQAEAMVRSLEVEALRVIRGGNLLVASNLVMTARSLGVELSELDNLLLRMAKQDDIADRETTHALLIHAGKSKLVEPEIEQIGNRFETAAMTRTSGVLSKDGIREDVFGFYMKQGKIDKAMEVFRMIESKPCFTVATAKLIEYELRTGRRLIDLSGFLKHVGGGEYGWKSWVHMWFVESLILTSSGVGDYLESPEAITAVQSGEVDIWLSPLAESLAKPGMKAPRMTAAFRKRLAIIVKKARSPFGKDPENAVETLIKAKAAGLV